MTDAPPDRQYPARPIVGVGAVIFVNRRHVLLIKRKHHPLAGRWSLPGGALELGETLHDAVRREVREETAAEIDVGPVIDVFEPIDRDDRNEIRYHYVVIDYLCRQVGGTVQAASDAAAAGLADPLDLHPYDLPALARQVIARGLEMAKEMGWWEEAPAPDPR
ncbi:MAG TPA: NUDIX hydrolase [Vicinamibacterales bacterium]|jgi:ADP-ribose pyrophosphatase YjhB (NUDIX family)